MGRVAGVLQLATLAVCFVATAAVRTAVVLDALDIQQTHSKFFQLLKGVCRSLSIVSYLLGSNGRRGSEDAEFPF